MYVYIHTQTYIDLYILYMYTLLLAATLLLWHPMSLRLAPLDDIV